MSDVKEGTDAKFVAKFVNAAGRPLDAPLPSDATAALDNPAAGTVAINSDGTNGDFKAGAVDGPVNVVVQAGGFTSAPFPFVVVPDNTPTGVVVLAA